MLCSSAPHAASRPWHLHARKGRRHGRELVEYSALLIQLLVDIPVVPCQQDAVQALRRAHRVHHGAKPKPLGVHALGLPAVWLVASQP
eukprot:365038-Chlamydomonas_euryale.AAC.10